MPGTETSERWIDGKCTKHSPAETRNWIKDSWLKTVQPEFKKFKAAIANDSEAIPNSFFLTKGMGHGNKNPLFLFLRPKKLLYIAVALEAPRQDSLVKIFKSYIQEWDECMTALQNRIPENTAVSRCRNSLQWLAEISHFIYGIDARQISKDWYENYKTSYFQACEAFADIPTHVAGSQQLMSAVKEALKATSTTKPKRKKRELSDMQVAINADAAKIVRQIRARSDPKTGQQRMSVMDALRILKRNPTYGPIISRLKFTDNTWKKYVANSRKRGRKLSHSQG